MIPVVDRAFVGVAAIVLLGFLERAGLLPAENHTQNYQVMETVISWTCTTILVIAWLIHHTITTNSKSTPDAAVTRKFSLQPFFTLISDFVLKKPAPAKEEAQDVQ